MKCGPCWSNFKTYLHGTRAYQVIALLVKIRLAPKDWHHVKPFKIKPGISGKKYHYKDCIVSKGFQQQARFDYFETFIRLIKWETIQIVSGLIGHCGWPIHHLDVQTTFLNGVFDEEMYMAQFDGLTTLGSKPLVCQLHRTLYGLKKSPHAWYFKMDSTLL